MQFKKVDNGRKIFEEKREELKTVATVTTWRERGEGCVVEKGVECRVWGWGKRGRREEVKAVQAVSEHPGMVTGGSRPSAGCARRLTQRGIEKALRRKQQIVPKRDKWVVRSHAHPGAEAARCRAKATLTSLIYNPINTSEPIIIIIQAHSRYTADAKRHLKSA
ncbi:hypothetical protein AAFF_G00268070 [Aldrovandia affinis]|uniref:Uncharacterized protein n=1 Tax=Aldrovandia affinis TaxID=143900 RepID=A0AAD7STA1_9TELE|nr:hypothetical protein AAFF_G00268070 [Aldrovandia affinis]